MKFEKTTTRFLFVLILFAGFLANAIGSYNPTTLQGWLSGIKITTFNFFVPNKQATKVAGGTLIETGNPNLLADPSFEGSGTSPWTLSPASPLAETSDVIDGKISYTFSPAAAPLEVSQDSTINVTGFADGVQGLAMARVKASQATDVNIQVCPRRAGAIVSSLCVDVPRDGKWNHIKIPFILGGTSNGISVHSEGYVAVTGTIQVDDMFVGAQDVKQDVSICDDVNCETNFNADISSTGVVTGENIDDWISSCSWSPTGTVTCTYGTELSLTTGMNCRANLTNWTQQATIYRTSTTSTGFSFVTNYQDGTTETAFNIDITVECTKTGADYTNAKARANGSVYSTTGKDTDWAEYTPTVSGFGTITNSEFFWKRKGSDLHIRGNFTTGTPAASTASVSMPNGIEGNSTIKSFRAGGFIRNVSAAPAIKKGGIVAVAASNILTFTREEYDLAVAPLTAQNGNQVAGTGEIIRFSAVVPVEGWENSNVIVGSFKDLDYVYARATGSSSSIGTTASLMSFNTEEKDTDNAFASTTFTVPAGKAGTYAIKGYIETGSVTLGAAQRFVCTVTAGAKSFNSNRSVGSGSSVQHGVTFGDSVELNDGDTVFVQCLSSVATSATAGSLSITRIPGQF